MVINKPTILIYVNHPDADYLREICAGIEEEGVLYQIREMEDELDQLAYSAANESMLGSGVGVSGRRVAMQMRRLSLGHNVFELNAPRFWQCRNLGANSARAIKKMPFKKVFGDEQL